MTRVQGLERGIVVCMHRGVGPRRAGLRVASVLSTRRTARQTGGSEQDTRGERWRMAWFGAVLYRMCGRRLHRVTRGHW